MIHEAHKTWLLQSCKKVSRILQVDAESEIRASVNSLVSDYIYFWTEREWMLPSFVILTVKFVGWQVITQNIENENHVSRAFTNYILIFSDEMNSGKKIIV